MGNQSFTWTLVAALALAVVHVEAWRLSFVQARAANRWLSAAGGVAVAYVFVHLLPELAQAQGHLNRVLALDWLERHAYVLALVGLLFFYGLEISVRRHRRRSDPREASPAVFWIHIGFFALYNGLIGYLLARGAQPLATFSFAMAVHFLVTDYGLRQHHPRQYRRAGRWVVSAAILAGWTAGALTHLPQAIVAALTGFVSGAIILNVLKEELPEARESSIAAFLAGAVAYGLLLLFV